MRAVLLLMCLLATSGCAVSSQHELDWATRGADNPEIATIQALSREFSAAYVRGDADSMSSFPTTAR